MTKMTFGAWLLGHKDGPDGEPLTMLAQHWEQVKGTTKLRSLPGIHGALEAAGSLQPGTMIEQAWATAIREWKAYEDSQGDSPVSAVPDTAGLTAEQAQAMHPATTGLPGGSQQLPGLSITGDSSADLDAAYRAATGQEPPPYVDWRERIESKLNWLHDAAVTWFAAMEITDQLPGGWPEPAWAEDEAGRTGWQEVYDGADFEAGEGVG